ncbi:phospholipase D-like domain-containing protein [Belnapia rosea]|uniref:phospholipase D-like domain-containing protein n=1 Tax=Belnapia rosea TaxID=938405 RepID=UPI0008917315|nr:phospholipase D-like domain-containing protein [Belnapia rosea]SDB69696.1 cardiolipin synthase [Belnapia rosea]
MSITRRGLGTIGAATLSACAQIPVLPEGPSDPMERQMLLAEVLDGAPLHAGNWVEVLDGGVAMFNATFRAIAGATDHVNIEFYILQDVRLPGLEGPSLFELLLVKLAQGVAVNIIHDGYGSSGTDFRALRAAGAQTLEFHPLDPLAAKRGWMPNDRDHRKLLVVDGRIGIIGGVNLDRVYQNPCDTGATPTDPEAACWHDTSIRIEGPAVASLQRLFFETWEREEGAPLPRRDWYPRLAPVGPARIRILGSAPGERKPRYYVTLVSAMEAARERIWLCTGYFVPTWQQRRVLRAAARRGVQVRLLLPSVSDSQEALNAQHAAYDDMLEAGVEIHEVVDGVLHGKVVVVDGVWSAVGSSNLDRRSVAWNNEADAIVLGRETAVTLERILEREFGRSRPVKLDEWERRGLGARLREQSSRLFLDLL